jgi:predicted Zn-dependent peptidase
VDLSELEALIYKGLDRMKTEPAADWELEKNRLQLQRQHAQGLYSTRGRAIALGRYAVYYGEPDLINKAVEKLIQVTQADLQRVAVKYLKQTNRTVVTTVPAPKGEARR